MGRFDNKGIMYDSFAGSSTVTKEYKFNVKSIAIANDSKSNIAFDAGYCNVTIAPGEMFDENLAPMNKFTITASGDFRCIVRGDG